MRINFFGDVCLDGVDTDNFHIDRRIAALAASADCNVANLESPLTLSSDGLPYQAHLIKAEPKPSEILDLFQVLSLANNHILDYGDSGLRHTMAFLQGLGKAHFGAGANRNQSLTPHKIERNGQKVAFLGFTRWHRATKHAAGATPDRIRLLTKTVAHLSGQGYFVAVCPHWNYEYVDYPAPSNRRIARRLIDAGADLVVGSHPHVIQGIERYRGKWIFHSLGNFIFDPSQLSRAETGDRRINETFAVSVDLKPDRSYTYQIVPIYTDARSIKLLDGEEAIALLRRVDQLSAAFHDSTACKRKFYQEAARATRKQSKQMANMIQQKGVMYILSRLHRVQLEDLKIRVHSMLSRSM
jgi:poly-gamma-glutamate capsule biosynthesis protein CapA/YwtB (metallophosphatase superfamily)